MAEVQISPASKTLVVGQEVGFLATAYDRNESVIPSARFRWSSTDLSVATVDPMGTVKGVAAGVVQIVAKAGDRQGTAVIQVVKASQPVKQASAPVSPPPARLASQPTVASIQIEPRAVYLLPSETQRLESVGYRESLEPVGPVDASWTSLRPEVAAVDEHGNITGISVGQTTVQSRSQDGLVASVPVAVQAAEVAIEASEVARRLSPAQVDTLRVIVPSQQGRALPTHLFSWTTSDAEIAEISPFGILTSRGPGRATITANGFFQSKSLEVVVHRRVEYLVSSPRDSMVYMPETGTFQFKARLEAKDRTEVPDAPIYWHVSDTAVVALDTAAKSVTGRARGRATVTVRGPGAGLEKRWLVEVVAGGLALSVNRAGLGPGEQIGIGAEFTLDDGTPIAPARGITWTSSDTTVATVDSTGFVRAVRYGHAAILAWTPWERSARAEIYVVPEILVTAYQGPGNHFIAGFERGETATRVGPEGVPAQAATYSPDRSRIAFLGSTGIWVMDADGGNTRALTTDSASDGRLQWTPDGRHLVFHSNRSGSMQIHQLNADGSGLRQLTPGNAVSMQPAISPDGEVIAFASSQDDNWDIFVMQRDGSGLRNVTRSPKHQETNPQYLANGQLVYLQEHREGRNTTWQVMQHEEGGTATPISVPDRQLIDYAAAPAGDLLVLIAAETLGRRGGRLVYRAYLQVPGAEAALSPVSWPYEGNVLTPAVRPIRR